MEFSYNVKDDEKLIEPLLDLDDTEVSYDDEDDDSICCTCTIQIGSDDSSDEDDNDEATVTCWDTTVLLIMFPLLLMAQFGMVFRYPQLDDSIKNISSWSTVNYMIVLFGATSWIYRHTLADLQVKNLFLVVLPEILLNVILGLVLWGNAAVGFVGLLGSLFTMGLFVACANFAILIMGEQ